MHHATFSRLLLVRIELISSILLLDVILYTTEALQPIEDVFLVLVRLELIYLCLNLDVILYTTKSLKPTKHLFPLLVRIELTSSSL